MLKTEADPPQAFPQHPPTFSVTDQTYKQGAALYSTSKGAASKGQ